MVGARRAVVVGAVVTAIAAAGTVIATGFVERIDRPAEVGVGATRAVVPAEPGDVIAIHGAGRADGALIAAVADAAGAVGASSAPVSTVTMGMTAVRRGDALVQVAPPSMQYPMVVTAIPGDAAAAVLGPEVAGVLATGAVVMGETTAGLRGAAVGDVVDLLVAPGAVRSLPIGMIAPDAVVGGAEIVVDTATGAALGIDRASRVLVWGFAARSTIESSLMRSGLLSRPETAVVRSWDPVDPDDNLSVARTKELLGEFAYRQGSDGSIFQDPAWAAANLPPMNELLNPQIQIRARCHLRVADDLRAALAEIAAAGLGGAIDVRNTNTQGGCHYPRLNRLSGQFGFLSRHSWGMAIDMNTVTNCQGCVPRMNCDVVRIFRKHNFAWGGNFTRPDGMHFEWVGEPRDQIAYPSRYCPNIVTPGADPRAGTADERVRETLLAGLTDI